MAASDALRRHLLGQRLQEDRQTLIDCHRRLGEWQGYPVPLQSDLFDADVRQRLGLNPRCTLASVLDALYGERCPTASMAIALALDEIDGTPGMWVAEVEEADRWESPDSEDSDDPEPTNAEQLGLLEVGR